MDINKCIMEIIIIMHNRPIRNRKMIVEKLSLYNYKINTKITLKKGRHSLQKK